MRTAAFVSGGMIPAALRGTTNGVTMHIVDWSATFAVLAGQEAKDDPPVQPSTGEHANPYRNIYGEDSFPPLEYVSATQLRFGLGGSLLCHLLMTSIRFAIVQWCRRVACAHGAGRTQH